MKNIKLQKGILKTIFLFFFFTLPSVSTAQINPKPNLVLVSTRAFHANYFFHDKELNGRGHFAPFKEVLGVPGKCVFEFYDNYIIQRAAPVTIIFFIQTIDKRSNGTIYIVKDMFGKEFLIRILLSKNEHLNITELDKLNLYKCNTLFII